MSSQIITVETTVAAPIDRVWKAYTTPADIMQWNAASDDWHTVSATVDLRNGGTFSSRMEAKDGSMGFDFAGTYTRIVPHELIEYAFGDRTARVEFSPTRDDVLVRVSFEAEQENSVEEQREGWQAILDNFAREELRPIGQSFSATIRGSLRLQAETASLDPAMNGGACAWARGHNNSVMRELRCPANRFASPNWLSHSSAISPK